MSLVTEELWGPHTDLQSSSGPAPDSAFLHEDDLALYDAHIRRPIGFAPTPPRRHPMDNLTIFARDGITEAGRYDVLGNNDTRVEVDVLGSWDSGRLVAVETFGAEVQDIAALTPKAARDLAAVLIAAANLAEL